MKPIHLFLWSGFLSAATTAFATRKTVIELSLIIPKVTITASVPYLCPNTEVTFTATPTYGGTMPAYQWQKNGNPVGSNRPTYTDATIKNADVIHCVLTSNDPIVTTTTATSNSIRMRVYPLPFIDPVGNQTVRAPNPTADIAFSGTGDTYTWTNDNPAIGLPASGTGDILAFSAKNGTNAPIVGTISAMPISTDGCVGLPTTFTMTVKPPYVASQVVIATTGTSTICAHTRVTFTATPTYGGMVPIYKWQKNGVNVGTNSNIYTDTALVHQDKIQCILKSNHPDALPATAISNAITMTVNALPMGAVARTTDILCNGDKSTVTLSATNGLAPYKYSTNGVNYQNTNVFELLAGNYNVYVLDNNGCTSVNTLLALTQPPLLTGSVQVDSLVCKGKSTALVVTTSGGTGNITYNLNESAFQRDNHFRVRSGTYMPQIRDAHLCLKTLPLVQVADATAQINQLKNTNLNCYETNLRIYPNPVMDILAVDFKISQPAVVKLLVYTALGHLIAEADYKNIEAGAYMTSWDTARWAANMVRICLEVDGKCVEVTPIMIIH
ncbi:MAG: hypothetical protein RLZZ628_2509 [Bacteroidota bacterium]|jgi:hypothetical protein